MIRYGLTLSQVTLGRGRSRSNLLTNQENGNGNKEKVRIREIEQNLVAETADNRRPFSIASVAMSLPRIDHPAGQVFVNASIDVVKQSSAYACYYARRSRPRSADSITLTSYNKNIDRLVPSIYCSVIVSRVPLFCILGVDATLLVQSSHRAAISDVLAPDISSDSPLDTRSSNTFEGYKSLVSPATLF